MLVHIFGSTDSPCCANFAFKTEARGNLENYSAMAIDISGFIINNENVMKTIPEMERTKSLQGTSYISLIVILKKEHVAKMRGIQRQFNILTTNV